MTQREALLKFIDLFQIKDNSVLGGHNISMFDVPILMNKLKEFVPFINGSKEYYRLHSYNNGSK